MLEKENHILDAEQWKEEAKAIIDDIQYHVRDIKICDNLVLPSSNHSIYLNLTTLEDLKFCIRLSSQGFNIVNNEGNYSKNTNDKGDNTKFEYYETIYSLLDSISPQYRNSFGKSLFDRLKLLSENQK